MKWKTRLTYRLLSPSTWDQIRSDWAISHRRLRNDWRRAAKLLAANEGLKLHLGFGSRGTTGWINVDAFEQSRLDLRWDLRDPFPCDSDIVSLVYCEHALEHLEYDDAQRCIAEIFRVLAPGGRIRLGGCRMLSDT
jgi:SAM-dependent methyltransferase